MSAGAFANYEEHVINSDPGNWVFQGALSESLDQNTTISRFLWSPVAVALRNSPSGAHSNSPCPVSLHETGGQVKDQMWPREAIETSSGTWYK